MLLLFMILLFVIGGSLIYLPIYITLKSRTNNTFVNIDMFFTFTILLSYIVHNPTEYLMVNHDTNFLIVILGCNLLKGVVVMYYDIYKYKYLRFDAPLYIYRSLFILIALRYSVFFKFSSIILLLGELMAKHLQRPQDTID